MSRCWILSRFCAFLERFKKPFLHQSLYFPLLARFVLPMHIHQPKHTKLKPDEVKELLKKYNVSPSQLPKIKQSDPAVPEGCVVGDVLKIERKEEDRVHVYYRVVA